MKKRIAMLLLAFSLCLALAACGSAEKKSEKESSAQPVSETKSEESKSEESKAESKEESKPESKSEESKSESKEESKSEAPKKTGKRVIKDQLGYEVELPEKIERVAIHRLLPLPSVYAVYKGGNVDGLISMPPDSLNAAEHSILSKYCPDILKVPTDYYKGGELNMEELLKLKPDVVFYSGSEKVKAQFDAAGIPAVGFSTTADPSTIGTMNKWIELMEEVFQEKSKVTGIVDYAKEVEAEIAKRLSDIPEEKRVKVLIIGHYSDTAFTLGKFGEYWSDATFSVNVGKGAKGNVSMEQVYEWNPDKIFISTLSQFFPNDFYNNQCVKGHDWSGVRAVQNKQVYKFPLGIHRWWPPSTDGPLALWWVAKNTYPEKFEDIDMTKVTKDYYKRFYGMDLSDEDVEWIMNPVDDMGRHYY